MLCCSKSNANERGRTVCRRFILHASPFILFFWSLAFAGRAEDTNGPAIHLSYGTDASAANPVADFMYFVPLISLQPVSSLTSAGSTQSVRINSVTRSFSRRSFEVTCEIDLTGDGWQRSVFDLSQSAERHERQLQNGGSVGRQLKSIDVQGSGAITVEVEGSVSNDVPTVSEVRLRFNAHGHASPVSIDLCDIRRVHGDVQQANEILARVNTLTFRRQAGPPKMEVSVASVKHKDAGDSLWQKFKGRVAGAAVNMFIDPLTVEAVGHQAMLDFGQALVAGAPTFTFPRARNLQAPKP
jgi:hypothetical protein